MQCVLGIDGGGTKTRARCFRLTPSGGLEATGEGVAAGSNPYSVGWTAAEAAIAAAARSAVGPTDPRPAGVVLAIAGCASEPARKRLLEWATSTRLAERVWVVPDTEPLLADASPGEPVVGLIAGTGSAAIARGADGATTTVGGWGYLIGDAGSGYALGRDALGRLAELADAGAAADALSAAILRQAGVAQPAELKALVYSDDDARAWVSRLAPTVLELAASGDAIASRIVETNVTALRQLAQDGASRIAATGSDRPRVLFAGGLLQGSVHYRNLTTKALVSAGWRPESLGLAAEAAAACARIAARRLNAG